MCKIGSIQDPLRPTSEWLVKYLPQQWKRVVVRKAYPPYPSFLAVAHECEDILNEVRLLIEKPRSLCLKTFS